jgi:hypothetical protein
VKKRAALLDDEWVYGEKMEMVENERIIGPDNYVTDDDNVERRSFELQMRLSEQVAEAER